MSGPAAEAAEIELATRLRACRATVGWDAALARAGIAERLLLACYDWALARNQPAGPLDLLMRGSGAQGVLSIYSDLDFEVSSPDFPRGHPAIEAAITQRLAELGVDAEGSTGRPREVDLIGQAGHTRDLHEMSELRRAGSTRRDAGWVGVAFAEAPAEWWNRTSSYEAHGRHRHAKFAFFEIRALICRVSWRHGLPAGTTAGQLAALRRVASATSAELRDLAIGALAAYEADPRSDSPTVRDLQHRMARLRDRHGLAGPDLDRTPSYDLRRQPPQQLSGKDTM